MFVSSTLIKNRELGSENILAFIIVFTFVLIYLKSKYTPYKKFISHFGLLKSIKPSTDEGLELHKTFHWYDPDNPLGIIYLAAIILGLTAIFNLVSAKDIITDSQNPLLGYMYHTTRLIMALSFVLFYWKNCIFAWWIALMYGPVLWIMYFLFHPFRITQEFLILVFFYGLIIGYLILKYKPYKDYLMMQPKNI